MLILLRIAKAIDETKVLNPEKLLIKNAFVNQATEGKKLIARKVQLIFIYHLIAMLIM